MGKNKDEAIDSLNQPAPAPEQAPAPVETPQASPAIKGKFEVVGVQPGRIYHHGFGEVDLRTVSAEVAEQLVTAGCQYLRRVE